jgi:hypothetical protein
MDASSQKLSEVSSKSSESAAEPELDGCKLPTDIKATCSYLKCGKERKDDFTPTVHCAECIRLRVPDAFSGYCSPDCLTSDAGSASHALIHANLTEWKARLEKMMSSRKKASASPYFEMTKEGRLRAKVAIEALTTIYVENHLPLQSALFNTARANTRKQRNEMVRQSDIVGVGQAMELSLQVLCFCQAFVDDEGGSVSLTRYLHADETKRDDGAKDSLSPFPQFSAVAWRRAVAYVSGFAFGGGSEQSLMMSAPPIAFLKHCCWPNATLRLENNNSIGISTLRRVEAGAEIHASYLPSILLPKLLRQESTLRRWGYRCVCERCSHSSSSDSYCEYAEADVLLMSKGALIVSQGKALLQSSDALTTSLKNESSAALESKSHSPALTAASALTPVPAPSTVPDVDAAKQNENLGRVHIETGESKMIEYRKALISATTMSPEQMDSWLRLANAFGPKFGLSATHYEVCLVRADALTRVFAILQEGASVQFPINTLMHHFHQLVAQAIWVNAQLLPSYDIDKFHAIKLATDLVKMNSSSLFLERMGLVMTAHRLSGVSVPVPPVLRSRDRGLPGQVGTKARVRAERAAHRFALRVICTLDPHAATLVRFVKSPLRVGDRMATDSLVDPDAGDLKLTTKS